MDETKKMSGPLGLKMSGEDAAEYMGNLLKGDHGLRGIEADCLDSWKTTTQEIEQRTQQLTKARSQIEAMANGIHALTGKQRAYVEMLIGAEEGRRNAAKRRDPCLTT